MEKFNFVPYEGTEKYIFISYAHANSHLIRNIAETLNNRGYNIWYDSGIEYGDKWIKSIEDHLKRASLILSFISPEYSQSDWCMREYTYAEKIGKKIVHIKIADGILEGGLAMMVSTRQIINDTATLTERQIINEVDRLLEKSMVMPYHSDNNYNDDFSGNIYSDSAKNQKAEEPFVEEIFSENSSPRKNRQSANYNSKSSKRKKSKKKKKGKSAGMYVAIAVAALAVIAVTAVIFVSCNSGKDSENDEAETIATTAPVYVQSTEPYYSSVYEETTIEETITETEMPETTTVEETTEPVTSEPETEAETTVIETEPETETVQESFDVEDNAGDEDDQQE